MAFSFDPDVIRTRTFAIYALAIFCRSGNRKIAFSTFDVETAKPFIVEILGLGSEKAASSQSNATSSNERFRFWVAIVDSSKLCGLLA